MPIPWTADAPAYGFNTTGESWLPQPAEWAELAHDVQIDDPSSTLTLYRALLAERRSRNLGAGDIEWLDGFGDDVVAFRNGGLTVIANLGDDVVELPAGEVLVASGPLDGHRLPTDTTAWIAAA